MTIETRHYITGEWQEADHIGAWLELLSKEAARQFVQSPSITSLTYNDNVRISR